MQGCNSEIITASRLGDWGCCEVGKAISPLFFLSKFQPMPTYKFSQGSKVYLVVAPEMIQAIIFFRSVIGAPDCYKFQLFSPRNVFCPTLGISPLRSDNQKIQNNA